MTELQYWDGWLEDNSKAPHEAISDAIENAEELLKALHKLRPDSLRSVSEEIDMQVGLALRSFLEDAFLFAGEPGVLRVSLADDIEGRFDILDFARKISEWRQDGIVIDGVCDQAKEAWAMSFDAAAALIRSSKGMPNSDTQA